MTLDPLYVWRPWWPEPQYRLPDDYDYPARADTMTDAWIGIAAWCRRDIQNSHELEAERFESLAEQCIWRRRREDGEAMLAKAEKESKR